MGEQWSSIKDQIENRSDEKARILIKAFASVPFFGADEYEPELPRLDEASLVLDEWSGGTLRGTHRQLMRNFPGWVRIDDKMRDLLEEISSRSEEFIQTLMTAPAEADHRFYLLGAIIGAIKGDWEFSERYSLVARDLSLVDLATLAEAEYWLAVSRRHITDPGAWRLASAGRRLRRAIAVTEDGDRSSKFIDVIRYKSELAALEISKICHIHIYGDSYVDEKSKSFSADEIFDLLQELLEQFVNSAHPPFSAIDFRLAVQIYTNLCTMYLHSWGFPPSNLKVGSSLNKQKAYPLFEDLRRLKATRGYTVSIPTQFVILAGDVFLEGQRAKLADIAELVNRPADVLIDFDRKLISDGLRWLQTGL